MIHLEEKYNEGIQKKEKALQERKGELDTPPQADEDLSDFSLTIVDQSKTLMKKIMLNGNYKMDYSAQLDLMFRRFRDNLGDIEEKIQTEEIRRSMTEMCSGRLPNIFSPVLMKMLLSEEIEKIFEACKNLIAEIHNFGKSFAFYVIGMIDMSTNSFPNLQAAFKQETNNVMAQCHKKCMKYVDLVLEKERTSVFTMKEDYMANVKKIQYESWQSTKTDVKMGGFKDLETRNMSNEDEAAFNMKVNLAAYMKVVHERMAIEIPLKLKISLEKALLISLLGAICEGQNTLMEENSSML